MFVYVNDSKPTGSFTNNANTTVARWDDSVVAWDSAGVSGTASSWDAALGFSADVKPSGSFTNDAKPS